MQIVDLMFYLGHLWWSEMITDMVHVHNIYTNFVKTLTLKILIVVCWIPQKINCTVFKFPKLPYQ